MSKKKIEKFSQPFRKGLLSRVSEEIRKGESLCINSMTGVGKKNFTVHLEKLLKSHISPVLIFVEIDLDNLFAPTPLAFYKLVLQELYSAAKMSEIADALKSKIEVVYNQNIQKEDEFLLFQAIKSTLNQLVKHNKIVIIFDGFDILRNVKQKGIFNNISAIRNISKMNISLIFITNRNLKKLWSANDLDRLYDILTYIQFGLKPLNETDSITFIQEEEQIENITLSTEKRKMLTRLSGGHAYFLKRLVKLYSTQPYLFRGKENKLVSELALSMPLLEQCRNIWATLAEEEKNLLLSLIRISKNKKLPFQKDDLDFLLTSGILKEDDDLIFFSPIFEAFVRNQAEAAKPSFTKTGAYKPSTCKDFLASRGLDFTRLSKVELELLGYFLKNRSKICSREEVANVLWEEQSTEKYSDWAIDQAIARLRKKIDDKDKNVLKTVKGIGYIFRD